MTTHNRALRILPALAIASAALVVSGAGGAVAGTPLHGLGGGVGVGVDKHVVTAKDVRTQAGVDVSVSLVGQLVGAVVPAIPHGDAPVGGYRVVVRQTITVHGTVRAYCPAGSHLVRAGAAFVHTPAGVRVSVSDNGASASAAGRVGNVADTLQVGLVCANGM